MVKTNKTKKGNGLILEGLRVVEIGHRISAPLAGMLLAEQGAEVIRIINKSSPGNEPILDAILSRGKRQVELELDKVEDRLKLQKLIGCADVVIENLPHHSLNDLWINFDEIRQTENRGLISCSIPAFPPDDPRAHMLDYEAVAGMCGYLYEKPIGKPWYYDFPVGSVLAGIYGANAIVAALIARQKIGRGQHIITSLFEAEIFAQIILVLIKTGIPRGFLPFKMIGTPFMSPWLCKDNRYIYLHISLPIHNAQILDLLEKNGYQEEIRYIRSILSPETARDPSQVKSISEAKKLRKAYEKIFLTKTADEWENLLGKELCCIKVRTAQEWFADSIAAGMNDVVKLEDPIFGEMSFPGPAIFPQNHTLSIKPRAICSDEVDSIIKDWKEKAEVDARSLSAIEAKALKENVELKHPLQGIKVLDLSRVIAGPCAARVLAEFGAEVVLIQNPSGLDWALSFHLVFNAGKKSASLNFYEEEGKAKLWAILEAYRPHALIQNYRHLDVAKSIGIHPEKVLAHFPDMVYTHLNAYGNEGGWKDRPGFEQVVQAVTGIQMSYGRGGKPKLLPTAIIDIGSGLAGSFATLLGLYHREKSGRGSFLATHLSTMAVYFQIHKMVEFQKDSCLKQAKEKNISIPFDPEKEIIANIVRTFDTYALIAGPIKDIITWFRAIGIADSAELSSENIWQLANKHFWKRPFSYWEMSLYNSGVGRTVAIVPRQNLSKLAREIRKYDRRDLPIVRRRPFPHIPSELTFVGTPVRMSLTPMKDVPPPPARGGDTPEILAMINEKVPLGTGFIPYPKPKPFFTWLVEAIRWAYFAWRSGNI